MRNKAICGRAACVSIGLSAFMAISSVSYSAAAKVNAAESSPFLENQAGLAPNRARSPFKQVYHNPSSAAWKRVANFNQIYVAPVTLRYLRPVDLKTNRYTAAQLAQAKELAGYMRKRMESEIASGGRYQTVSKPGPKTLTLELAIIELRPTNFVGNVASTGAGVALPGAYVVGSQFTKGKIAVEGRLKNASNGEVLMAFADSKQDKMSLFSFRDFSPTAHNRRAVDDWAIQLRELSKTSQSKKVAGTSAFTLNPF